MKPVFIINGFLESGKTAFISYTLSQPYFQSKGKTLLIVCEEGENEYDEQLLAQSGTVMEVIEDERDFTTSKLMELEKKYKPTRILLEWNGMWNFKTMKLPWHWSVEQQITMIDATTFNMYYANMRSLLAEMLRKSELVICNRADAVPDLGTIKRSVKSINPKTEIVFEGKDGELNAITEEDLPYNLNDPVITLDDYGYGVFFIDSNENLDRYVGKTIKFLAQVMMPPQMKGMFVPGRMFMNCCAEDMQFMGYPCHYDKIESLEQKSWVTVTAVVKKEFFSGYGEEGPILQAVEVEPAKAPKDPVINFT